MKQAVLGLALCALPLAPALAADCKPLQLVASVSLLPAPDHLAEFVPVKFNGTEKKLLLDTGGYTSQVSPEAVEELKLPVGGAGITLRDMSGKESSATASVSDFQVGTMRARDFPLQIMPSGNGLDGILSVDLFLRYDLDMDFGNDKLNFVSTDHCDGKVIYWKADAVAEVPMRIVDGHYLIELNLDGRSLFAMIDTGSDQTILSDDTAKLFYGLEASPEDIADGKKNGLPPYFQHKFETLSLDGVEIHTPTIGVVHSTNFEKRHAVIGSHLTNRLDTQDHYDMLLGMDIMRHLHIYIATKERKVYITPA